MSKCVHTYPQKFRNFLRTSAQAESSRIRSRGGQARCVTHVLLLVSRSTGSGAREEEKGKASGLLQRVQQARNRPVQIFVRPPQLLDLIDRVQHSRVMLAAELPANLRQRSCGE